MFGNELADSSILKTKVSVPIVYQSLTSVGKGYIVFFWHENAKTDLLLDGKFQFFVSLRVIPAFKCVKLDNYG